MNCSLDDRISAMAGKLAEKTDTDIIFFNGDLTRPAATSLIQGCNGRQRRRNVMLILVTLGGEPDVAYKMARYLQKSYDQFSLLIHGQCKSAGTLVAVGAHELIISELGELGPIDIQMRRADEATRWHSVLTLFDVLTDLHDRATEDVISFIRDIIDDDELGSTLSLASDVSVKTVTSLLSEIYRQIDPIQLGEVIRAMDITARYGERLIESSESMSPEDLDTIVTGYPSHSFVIDRTEADSLFRSVRSPNPLETEILEMMGEDAHEPRPEDDPTDVVFLSEEPGTVIGEAKCLPSHE